MGVLVANSNFKCPGGLPKQTMLRWLKNKKTSRACSIQVGHAAWQQHGNHGKYLQHPRTWHPLDDWTFLVNCMKSL